MARSPAQKGIKGNFRAAFVRPNDNIAPIDGLRAISCLAIMLYHSFFLLHLFIPFERFAQFVKETPFLLTWIWGLDKSVDVFFVISGFLIGRMLFKEHRKTGTLNLKTFYWRRYLRLTPVYLFAIGVFYLLAPNHSQTLWANILYINNFLPLESMSMPWTWTLAVEEQFYLLFPLLLLTLVFATRSPLAVLLSLFALSFVIRGLVASGDAQLWDRPYSEMYNSTAAIIHYFDTLYVNLPTRYGTLLCGVILAYLTVYYQPALDRLLQCRRLCTWLTVLALALMVGGVLLNGNKHWLGDSLTLARLVLVADRNLFGILLCWLILMCSAPAGLGASLGRFFGARVWFPFAQLSYSMYLFHYMVAIPLVLSAVNTAKAYYGAEPAFDYWWFMVVFAALVLVTFPVSLCTFALIERPFINMRKPAPVRPGTEETTGETQQPALAIPTGEEKTAPATS